MTLKLVDALRVRAKPREHEIVVHDPFLGSEEFDFRVEKNLYKAIEGVDCIILATAHSGYKKMDWEEIRKRMGGDLVVDVRGFFDAEEVEAKGLRYKGIGRIFQPMKLSNNSKSEEKETNRALNPKRSKIFSDKSNYVTVSNF